jgi:prevent-host-death family protein
MQVGTAEARERFKELLDRVQAGERVEIARRGKVLAVLSAPPENGPAGSFRETVRQWRATWGVASWPDEDVFADVRDPSAGRDVEL